LYKGLKWNHVGVPSGGTYWRVRRTALIDFISRPYMVNQPIQYTSSPNPKQGFTLKRMGFMIAQGAHLWVLRLT